MKRIHLEQFSGGFLEIDGTFAFLKNSENEGKAF